MLVSPALLTDLPVPFVKHVHLLMNNSVRSMVLRVPGSRADGDVRLPLHKRLVRVQWH